MIDETKTPEDRAAGVTESAGPPAGEDATESAASRETGKGGPNQGPHQEEAGMRS